MGVSVILGALAGVFIRIERFIVEPIDFGIFEGIFLLVGEIGDAEDGQGLFERGAGMRRKGLRRERVRWW